MSHSKVFVCRERGVCSAVCGRETNELTITFFVVIAFNFVFHVVIKIYKKTLVEHSELHLDLQGDVVTYIEYSERSK